MLARFYDMLQGEKTRSRRRSRSKKKEPEPEPEPQKICQPCTGSKKIKNIKKLYICYSSLGKIVSFKVKNTIILLALYFLQFYISKNVTNS